MESSGPLPPGKFICLVPACRFQVCLNPDFLIVAFIYSLLNYREEDRRFKYNSSFVHRLPTIRRSGNKAQHAAKAASAALTVSETDREVASNGGVNKKFIPEAYKNSSGNFNHISF